MPVGLGMALGVSCSRKEQPCKIWLDIYKLGQPTTEQHDYSPPVVETAVTSILCVRAGTCAPKLKITDSYNSTMLLTLTTTHNPATDLGYLLHKNPAKLHSFELSFGKAHVFYPEATAERCTAALLNKDALTEAKASTPACQHNCEIILRFVRKEGIRSEICRKVIRSP